MSATPSSSAAATVQEYTVRVPKVAAKQNRVMQFNSSLLVDFTKWSQVKMVREVPVKTEQGPEEPKSGAGSEYGKELREEARRKKLGIVTKKRSTDTFPWLMKVGGKNGKKYRGVRGGSVTENASYYVFTQAKDGAFEAYPITEWYTFQPIQRYKALSAEEAEEQFNKRDKIMNYFSVMVKNRLKPDDQADVDDEDKPDGKGKAGLKKKKKSEFKLTDMDEWPDSSDDDGEDGDGDGEDGEDRKKKKKDAAKAKAQRKKRKKDVKDEAFEDSDDGDDEGRELDYISDSSESEEEKKPEKEERGVDQEDALKRLLDSDAEMEESSSEEEKKSDEDEEKEAEDESNTGEKKKKSKKKKKRKEESVKEKEESKSSDSDQAADSSEDEVIAEAKAKKAATGAGDGGGSAGLVQELSQSSPGGTAAAPAPASGPAKRKVDEAIAAAAASNAKRARTEAAAAALPSAAVVSETGITEDAVRRYLTRKPMTTTELLQKFKSKKVGLSSDQLVPVIAQILKKINPNKQTIKGKMYLSIKK